MTFKRVLLNTCQEEFEGAAENRQACLLHLVVLHGCMYRVWQLLQLLSNKLQGAALAFAFECSCLLGPTKPGLFQPLVVGGDLS